MSSLVEATQLTEGTVEVTEKAKRRAFTAEYKRRILVEAGTCTKLGEIGALLRREGIYSSHLADWRKARTRGEIAGLAPKKRGPEKKSDANSLKVAELTRETEKLRARAERAEALVELQKKVSEILGIALPTSDGKR